MNKPGSINIKDSHHLAIDNERRSTHWPSAKARSPYRIGCAPDGRYVFSTWGDYPKDRMGPHRWRVSLGFSHRDDLAIEWIREDIPGADRVLSGTRGKSMNDAPRTWGRRVVFAATDDGVWLGTGDDYKVEFLDWTGNTRTRVRWSGPSVGITQAHIDALQDQRLASAGGTADHAFERRWSFARSNLPSRFPTVVASAALGRRASLGRALSASERAPAVVCLRPGRTTGSCRRASRPGGDPGRRRRVGPAEAGRRTRCRKPGGL